MQSYACKLRPCTQIVAMKNITLSADEHLIEWARQKAASENTTLNAEFRQWLAQ